jgi:hypothetical protein
MEPESPTLARKLVKQDTMQTVVLTWTDARVPSKMSRLPHERIWQFFTEGLARRLTREMFRRTLESPTKAYWRDIALKNKRDLI